MTCLKGDIYTYLVFHFENTLHHFKSISQNVLSLIYCHSTFIN